MEGLINVFKMWSMDFSERPTAAKDATAVIQGFKKKIATDYLVADSEEHKEFRLGTARKPSVGRPMLAGQKPNPK